MLKTQTQNQERSRQVFVAKSESSTGSTTAGCMDNMLIGMAAIQKQARLTRAKCINARLNASDDMADALYHIHHAYEALNRARDGVRV